MKGKTYLAFSSDSSCTRNLDNSTSGYETLILSKTTNQKKMPNYVKSHLQTLVLILTPFVYTFLYVLIIVLMPWQLIGRAYTDGSTFLIVTRKLSYLDFQSGHKVSGSNRWSSMVQWHLPISMATTAIHSSLSIRTTKQDVTLSIPRINGTLNAQLKNYQAIVTNNRDKYVAVAIKVRCAL